MMRIVNWFSYLLLLRFVLHIFLEEGLIRNTAVAKVSLKLCFSYFLG